jgi:hypothetical protein
VGQYYIQIKYNYFNSGEIIEEEDGSYAGSKTAIKFQSITWNHSISEVITSMLKNGLEINSFNEFNYSPYDCFNNTEKIGNKKYIIKPFQNKAPLIYSITALKK